MSKGTKVVKLIVLSVAACYGSYYVFRNSLSKNLLEAKYCKDAIELVKNHNGAKIFLGEPIEAKFAKVAQFAGSGEKLAVQVSVSGPKSGGEVFFVANKTDNNVELESVQLKIGRDNTKRLEIKAAEKDS